MTTPKEAPTDDLIARARKLVAEATPGASWCADWIRAAIRAVHKGCHLDGWECEDHDVEWQGRRTRNCESPDYLGGDAALIAAAPTLITELADALEEAQRCRMCDGGGSYLGAKNDACESCKGTGRDR